MSTIVSKLPEEDFSNPLERLKDSHRRIEKFLDLTLVLASKTSSIPSPADREHLNVALRYLRKGPRTHSEDEEISLFPRLREVTKCELTPELLRVNTLEDEHNAAAHSHRLVEELFERWLRNGPLNRDQHKQIVELTRLLREAYRTHIEFEDTVLFPLASKLLSDEQLDAMGLEMLRRRARASAVSNSHSKCTARRKLNYSPSI